VFTWEYSKASTSTRNEKCREQELIRPGATMPRDRKARVDFE
jgi:hypothetical protein